MSTKLDKLITELLRSHVGGEGYFSQLDARLQQHENLDIIQELLAGIDNTIAVTGRFGDYIRLLYNHRHVFPLSIIHFTGSLRRGAVPRVLYASSRLTPTVTFVDDSFYSGKTYGAVSRVLYAVGFDVAGCRVVYDGCPDKWSSVSSLYRYYDRHPRVARNVLIH